MKSDPLPGCSVIVCSWSDFSKSENQPASCDINPIRIFYERQEKQKDIDKRNGEVTAARKSTRLMRAAKALHRLNVNSLERLQCVSTEEWSSCRNFGKKTYKEVEDFANEHGIKINPFDWSLFRNEN